MAQRLPVPQFGSNVRPRRKAGAFFVCCRAQREFACAEAGVAPSRRKPVKPLGTGLDFAAGQ